VFRVLFHGDVHLHLESDRAAVGVVWIRVVFGCALGQTARLTLTIDLFEDRDETHPLSLEPTFEPIQC